MASSSIFLLRSVIDPVSSYPIWNCYYHSDIGSGEVRVIWMGVHHTLISPLFFCSLEMFHLPIKNRHLRNRILSRRRRVTLVNNKYLWNLITWWRVWVPRMHILEIFSFRKGKYLNSTQIYYKMRRHINHRRLKHVVHCLTISLICEYIQELASKLPTLAEVFHMEYSIFV